MSLTTSKKSDARRFVPTVDARLEERVALSSGPAFTPWGAAVLTYRAFNNAAAGIRDAFTRFATKGLNYGRLNADLQKSISVIPYNRMDGLSGTMRNEVHNVYVDIVTGKYRPVIGAMNRALASLDAFVKAEVASGKVVLR